MKVETLVRRALTRKDSFDPRGSRCPICKAKFRTGCNHSVAQAEDKLHREYISAIARATVRIG